MQNRQISSPYCTAFGKRRLAGAVGTFFIGAGHKVVYVHGNCNSQSKAFSLRMPSKSSDGSSSRVSRNFG